MGDIEAMYDQVIRERARDPRHQVRLEPFDVEWREVNAFCGDRITLRLRCDDTGTIAGLGYEARACAICVAAADLMAEIAFGMSAAEADDLAAAFAHALREGEGEAGAWQGRLAPLSVFAPLRATKSRIRCAMLPWEALGRALRMERQANAS